MTAQPSELLRPKEAAEYLRMSEGRLARMRHEGNTPAFIRAGKSILYRRADIDEWLQARVRRSTSDNGLVAAE